MLLRSVKTLFRWGTVPTFLCFFCFQLGSIPALCACIHIPSKAKMCNVCPGEKYLKGFSSEDKFIYKTMEMGVRL